MTPNATRGQAELRLALSPEQRRQVGRAWFRVVLAYVVGAALAFGLLALPWWD